MAAKPYQYIEYEILRRVLGSPDAMGLPGDLSSLSPALRSIIPEISDREIVATLKRLTPKYLTIWKYSETHRRSIPYPAEIQDDVEVFYRPGTYLRPTAYTDPYIQELAALLPAPEPEQARKKYGF
jgi:hypothetical protein